MKDARTISIPFDGMDKSIIIPESECMFIISEGSGDNLLPEDVESGYVDYVNWERYDICSEFYDGMIDAPEIREGDGGMVLFKDYARDLTLGTIITEVLKDSDIKETETACLMGHWLDGIET